MNNTFFKKGLSAVCNSFKKKKTISLASSTTTSESIYEIIEVLKILGWIDSKEKKKIEEKEFSINQKWELSKKGKYCLIKQDIPYSKYQIHIHQKGFFF